MHPISNLRHHYRVVFPVGERPRLLLAGGFLPVLDCSESGLRVHVGSEQPFAVGDEVSGRVRFSNGDEHMVSGTVLRIQDSELAIHMGQRRLPFGTILKQQLYLRSLLLRIQAERPSGRREGD